MPTDAVPSSTGERTLPEIEEELIDVSEVPVRVLLRRVRAAGLRRGCGAASLCEREHGLLCHSGRRRCEQHVSPTPPHHQTRLHGEILRGARRARGRVEERRPEDARRLPDAQRRHRGGRRRVAARAFLRDEVRDARERPGYIPARLTSHRSTVAADAPCTPHTCRSQCRSSQSPPQRWCRHPHRSRA